MSDRTTARAIRGGLLAWPTAGAVYLLHITIPLVVGTIALDLVAVFLMGSGCVALHAAALRSPRVARWLSPRVLMLVSAAAGACAVMAAGMVVGGLFDPTPSNLLIGQIMLQAPAVVSLISLDTLRAVHAGAGSDKKPGPDFRSLDCLTTDQLVEYVRAMQLIIAVRLTGEQKAVLHVIRPRSAPDGSSRAGSPTRPLD